jgi:hypothetical protein
MEDDAGLSTSLDGITADFEMLEHRSTKRFVRRSIRPWVLDVLGSIRLVQTEMAGSLFFEYEKWTLAQPIKTGTLGIPKMDFEVKEILR